MVDPAELSALIGAVYDAALDPALWRPTLIRICSFLRSGFCIQITEDAASSKAHVHYTSKDDPEWMDAYFGKYIYLNPILIPAALRLKPGDVYSVTTFITMKEFRASAFYREWCGMRGYCDAVGALLEKSQTNISLLSAVRTETEGPADAAARRRMQLIAPHVRRAVTIGRVLDLNHVMAARLSETLDGFRAGILVVDAQLHIIHANKAALGLLESGEALRRVSAVLSTADETSNAALSAAVEASAKGDAAVGTKGLAIPIATRKGATYVAHVLPLTSGTRRDTGTAYGAVAAIFVRETSLEMPSPLETLADHYRLTPRELSVLLAIVELPGVPAVSSMLGLSPKTVKRYVRSVFEKTGSNRQADLVKVVAGFANPFAAARQG